MPSKDLPVIKTNQHRQKCPPYPGGRFCLVAQDWETRTGRRTTVRTQQSCGLLGRPRESPQSSTRQKCPPYPGGRFCLVAQDWETRTGPFCFFARKGPFACRVFFPAAARHPPCARPTPRLSAPRPTAETPLLFRGCFSGRKCTPLVIQYIILSNKWGAVQKPSRLFFSLYRRARLAASTKASYTITKATGGARHDL